MSARASERARGLALAVALACALGSSVVGCDEPSGLVLRVRRDAPATGRGARLIAYGGGVPRSAADLDAIATAIETGGALVFDGMVLDLGYARALTRAPVDAPEADAMAARLARSPLSQMTESYVLVEVRPGDMDWRDEASFAPAVENVRRAAASARAAGARGLFLDTQAYEGQLFSLPDVAPGASFEDVALAVRERARAIMRAVLGELADPVIVLTLGPGEVWRSVCLDGVALELDRYGLLPSFVDGLGDEIAAAGRGTVIDGQLGAYPVTQVRALELLHAIGRGADDAELAARWIPGVPTYRWPRDPALESGEITLPDVFAVRCAPATAARVRRPMRAGLGLMLDYEQVAFESDPALFDRNYRTPAELRAVLGAALERADGLVWLFAANVDLFARPSTPLTPLPDAYRDAILQARVVIGDAPDAGAP
ncbi:MAG: hypothetical protein M3Y87_23540 [Myxococcota bacterium]|nr:hypothetical protein [Myxococcota bacterium]